MSLVHVTRYIMMDLLLLLLSPTLKFVDVDRMANHDCQLDHRSKLEEPKSVLAIVCKEEKRADDT